MHTVFVYGTLKRGFPNFVHMSGDVRFVGQCTTCECFPLVIGGQWFTPYLFDEPGVGHRVKGELFAVGEAELQLLDRLEGVGAPGGYHRRQVQIEVCGARNRSQAWAYLMQRRHVSLVHSQEYLAVSIT